MKALLLLLAIGAPAAAPAESQAPAAVQPAVVQEERLDTWPDVESTEALRTSLAKIRKAASEEMERQGQAEILAMGPGAAPLLLKALGKERDKNARRRIETALDAVTTAQYTRALAKSFGERRQEVQHYALQRVAVLGDPGLREEALELWADLEARRADSKKKSKVDPEIVDDVALLVFSCGSIDSIAHMVERAGQKGFIGISDTLNAAAANARTSGDESSKAVAAALADALGKDAPMKVRLGALRLLTFAGSKDNARAVLPQLDAPENQVKIAAINALRQMVDGDPPIEKLSAFDAIERAKKWKSRL